ncbi:MAG TPA: hypothetical protein VMJ12_00590 [Candidatus Acidoferrales bacterium]|nr:hypothetical protein [Candidatus Acidoferrales bacterium]
MARIPKGHQTGLFGENWDSNDPSSVPERNQYLMGESDDEPYPGEGWSREPEAASNCLPFRIDIGVPPERHCRHVRATRSRLNKPDSSWPG